VHINVGSLMLAGLAGITIVFLLAMVVVGSRSKKPDPTPPTSAERAARAVRIARRESPGGATVFVPDGDNRAHPVVESRLRNRRHPNGHLVRIEGDEVRLAEVLENETLSSVNNTRFTIYRT